jgi:hypothetical protein
VAHWSLNIAIYVFKKYITVVTAQGLVCNANFNGKTDKYRTAKIQWMRLVQVDNSNS